MNTQLDTNDIAVDSVWLDRSATTTELAIAREIFESKTVGRSEKYTEEVAAWIVIVTNVGWGVAGNAVWELVKYSWSKAREFCRRTERDTVGVNVELTSRGLTWDIRGTSDMVSNPYHQGRIINSVDTNNLPADCARISINLLERRTSFFDAVGLPLEARSWPDED